MVVNTTSCVFSRNVNIHTEVLCECRPFWLGYPRTKNYSTQPKATHAIAFIACCTRWLGSSSSCLLVDISIMTTIYAVVKVNGVHVVNDCDIPMFMVLICIQCVHLVDWTSFSIVHQSRKHVCQWQAHLNRGHSIHRSHQIHFNIQLCLGECHLLIAHCLKWCSILVIMPELDERSSR